MKPSFLILVTSLLFTFCAPPQKQQTDISYKNPVIAGDFPDPTIIRVGDTYYAAGTSCDFAPNYPIYESKDLINWARIGAVFNEPPEWSSDDFWAPELFYKDGTFFVYYTTKRKDNRIACIGVATTKDIHKGFTDHGIIIEWGEEAIDAFIFQDDDEKLYITWKAYGLTQGRDIEILASELSPDGLNLMGDHFTLTDFAKGWQGEGSEGQCIVKRNGMYYLLYSIGGCCDNRCDYRVKVARSKNLRSGWEQLPEPILQGSDIWKCTGHGTLVTTPDNRDFYLYHSYNATDFEYIGRQGMLDEILWDKETGWPYFKNGMPSETAKNPFENTLQHRDSVWIDDFSNSHNIAFLEWDVWIPKPDVEVSAGEIRIKPNHSGYSFLGLRPKTGTYNLSVETLPENEAAGIGIYSNQENLMAFTVNHSELFLTRISNGEKVILAQEKIADGHPKYLKFEADKGRYFHFFWSQNGEDWVPVKVENEFRVDGTGLAQWGFAPRVGFVLTGADSVASFSELRMEYKYIK